MEKGTFRNDTEKARLAGMGPEAMKQSLLRQRERQRKEDAFEQAHGRPMTPEERLAYDLAEGAQRHEEAGNREMATKNQAIARRLLDGELKLQDAYDELGFPPDPTES